jgi:1,4-dihydroxy-2-naphthoate octaprenyltransferase/chlorophyll synthase
MVLGQVLGGVTAGAFSAASAGFGVAFTILDLVFIVLLNDWGDRMVDAIKRRAFPEGCSPKTIPDRILPATHVLVGGLVAGMLAVIVAFVAASALSRPLLGVAGLACIGLFVAYTLPPIAANYRGGGELLEMLGIGVALPWLNAYAQSGALMPRGASLLAGFSVLALASAVASGLSDEETDRQGGKSTVVTRMGNRSARRLVETFMLLGAALWLGSSLTSPRQIPLIATAPAAALVLWQYFRVRAISPEAITNAFSAQGRYKRELHRAIWWGGTAVAVGLVFARFCLG